MAKRNKRRASNGNRAGMAGIALVVAVLLSTLLYQSHKLEAKNVAYGEQIQQLQDQIDVEEARAQELEKLPEYVQSKEYIEMVAREKFGLVYEDENIFRSAQ